MLKFFKQFLIYGFASVIGKIAAVFLMPFYTNVLTKEEYGTMALITACKGIIDLVSNFNIHSGIARDYFEDGVNRKKLISTGFFSIVICSLLVLFIMYFSRNIWINNVLNIRGYEAAFIVMILSIPSGSLLSYFAILTRFKNKPISYSFGSVAQLLIQISLSVYLVLIVKTGIVGVFLAVLIAECFGIIYFGILNRENLSFTFDKSVLKRALIFSLPTLPAILAGWIDSSMGQIMVGQYVSMEELGVYSVALQLVSVFSLISVALNNVWSPYVYENYKKKNFNFEVEKLFKLIVIILIIITFNVSLLSKDIVLLLSNSTYVNASKYFTLLCFPMGLFLLFPFVSVGVTLNRTTKYLSYSYVTGSLVNLVLLFLLLPILGVVVVPICLTLSRIVNFSMLNNYSQKAINIKYSKTLLVIFLFVTIFSFFIIQLNLNHYYLFLILLIFDTMAICYCQKKYKMIDIIKTHVINPKIKGE